MLNAIAMYRPLALATTVSPDENNRHLEQSNFISNAGCDITIGARVYLLYEMPLTLLARRFNDSQNINIDKFKILVSKII